MAVQCLLVVGDVILPGVPCTIDPFAKVRGLVGSATLRMEKLVRIGLEAEFVRRAYEWLLLFHFR